MMRKISFKKNIILWSFVAAIQILVVSISFATDATYGPGRVGLMILAGHDHTEAGTGGMWNSRYKLHIQLDPADGWRIRSYKVDLGGGDEYSPPLTPTGNPKIGHFDYKDEFAVPYENENSEIEHLFRRTLVLDLEEDLGMAWGAPFADLRSQGVAIFLNLARLDGSGQIVEESGAWAVPELIVWSDESEDDDEVVADESTGEITENKVKNVNKTSSGKVHKGGHQHAQQSWETDESFDIISFNGGRWGWWFRYEITHPRVGHFIDSPVAGIGVQTPTYEGVTDATASFDFFPGEEVDIAIGTVHLGSTVADKKISPLDIFPLSDTDNPSVINMARLLQSLDVDADAQAGINITEDVVLAFEQSMEYWGLSGIDFANDDEVENIIAKTIEFAGQLETPILLVSVSAEDAKEHLDDTLNNSMFRKNISKTPELGSTKAKMNISTIWFPARRANDEETVIEYYDEDGNFLKEAITAKPIIITYTDADPTTHAMDTWAAISRDDGETWKRKNLSRSGDLSSFTLNNGDEYYGYCKKPVFQVKGNKILVGWTSKFAKGGKPRYSEDEFLADGVTLNPSYTDDIWGVGGPQRSVDYVTEGYPEAGEIPYSCVWTCRGLIATQSDVNAGRGEFVGDIVWYKPERLTSARRDANLIFLAGAPNAGFGMVWQEDPKGLRPGRAIGPGPGWGGATTNHKTDIWYSYVSWADHSMIDEDFVAGGDPEHDLDHITRPKALVPMSLPIRISDNEVLNEKNMGLDETTDAESVAFEPENLTRCVKFVGGKTIVEADDPDAGTADYTNLRPVPEDHQTTMNCTNCHVPFATEPMGTNPTQGAPIPVVVLDTETNDYLGGFNNGDCVSCHWSHIVPRDRVIAMTPGLDEDAKCAECEASDGIWYDGTDGTEIVEAYYPYEGYPLIFDDGDVNDGTHRYGLELPGLLVETPGVDTPRFFTFTNFSDTETSVGITLGDDGIAETVDDLLMDGDTGASRGNLFMQPYIREDGTTSAWAIVTYEETKGAGAGPPDNTGESDTHRDDYLPESGKNVIYHSFDFMNPDMVSAGDVMNMPECVLDDTEVSDSYGNDIVMPLLDVDGNITPKYLTSEPNTETGEPGELILDWKGRPQIAYENARRGRFIMQGWGAVRSSRTVMMMVYKMGMEGAGRPSDIMTQIWQIPEDEIVFKHKDNDLSKPITGVYSVVGNPYRFENIIGNRVQDGTGADGVVDEDGNSVTNNGSGQIYFASGAQNMSSVTPSVTTLSAGDPEYDDAYGAIKVVEWEQTVENLADLSDKNHFDDARAHRGQLRGDFVQLGFSYCPNWAASRNGNDKYDFYLRRSFNGGKTWTTDPSGSGVTHCITWTTPSGLEEATAGTKEEVCFDFAAGDFERMRNLTQLPNSKESVIEPRVVAVPGTIKTGGVWTGLAEDKQDINVFYVAWGTSTNPKKDPITGEQDEPHPTDLYWSFSQDKGETYHTTLWDVNPDSDGTFAGEEVEITPWMAKGDQEQGEVQLRMTPDGSKFYASWLDEGEEGSDIVFRRIMSADFPSNVSDSDSPIVLLDENDTTSGDFTDDSGGE